MLIEIPDEIFTQPDYGKRPFLVDVALMLYQEGRISLAKAAHIAKVNRMEFQEILAERKIPIAYDLKGDLEALKKLENRG